MKQRKVSRIACNTLLSVSLTGLVSCQLSNGEGKKNQDETKPNLIFVFADQWRAQDLGYTGNEQVRTSAIDQLSRESANLTNAVSNCPVSSPYRASMLTGKYPLSHGIFYNDKPLDPSINSIAKVYKNAGYETGYIGKWHVNGHPKGEDMYKHRSMPVTKERRQGFDFWRVLECTHDYNHSKYYDENDSLHLWDGYDAIAQTDAAVGYIEQNKEKPFILFLSWGPPHNPYQTAPEEYRAWYQDTSQIKTRPNVPKEMQAKAKIELAGYYAHIAALDDCLAKLQQALMENDLEDHSIFVFTSDHGDMIKSHGLNRKQKPWDESVHVPLLIKYPKRVSAKNIDMPIGTPDLMPTLLGLSGLEIPESVEGRDYSKVLTGEAEPDNEGVLMLLPVAFHEWAYRNGGREWRGVRTRRYTYAEDLNGAWLLYDNQEDPYQLENLANLQEYANIQDHLAKLLKKKLLEQNDEFLPGPKYMELWDYDRD